MGKRYSNPPIVEIACEFKFSDDSPWDMTTPGFFYEKVKSFYPEKEQRIFTEIENTPQLNGEIVQKFTSKESMAFFTPDRNRSLQIRRNDLIISLTRPYTSWKEFRPAIDYAYQSLTEMNNPNSIQRIGLRYINRIEIPEKSFNFADYFMFYPAYGDAFPGSSNFRCTCIFPFNDERDLCRVQLTDGIADKPDTACIFLDIDYYLAQKGIIEASNALEWIEAAHSNIDILFEGSITDKLRLLFQEIKE